MACVLVPADPAAVNPAVDLQAPPDDQVDRLQPAIVLHPASDSVSEGISVKSSRSVSTSSSSRRGRNRIGTPPPAPLTPRPDEGVVIQAGMSFALGHRSTSEVIGVASLSERRKGNTTAVRHHFQPIAAHAMKGTQSAALTKAIKDFLGRTDHVMNEWQKIGRSSSSVRCESLSICAASRSRSVGRCTSYAGPMFYNQRRASTTRSVSSGRFSSSEGVSSMHHASSFHSVHSYGSADSQATDFGSCQDLNDYGEVFRCILFSCDSLLLWQRIALALAQLQPKQKLVVFSLRAET